MDKATAIGNGLYILVIIHDMLFYADPIHIDDVKVVPESTWGDWYYNSMHK